MRFFVQQKVLISKLVRKTVSKPPAKLPRHSLCSKHPPCFAMHDLFFTFFKEIGFASKKSVSTLKYASIRKDQREQTICDFKANSVTFQNHLCFRVYSLEKSLIINLRHWNREFQVAFQTLGVFSMTKTSKKSLVYGKQLYVEHLPKHISPPASQILHVCI